MSNPNENPDKMDNLEEDSLNEFKVLFGEFKLFQTSSNEVTLNPDAESKHEAEYETRFFVIVSRLDEVIEKLKKDSADYLKLLSMKVSMYYEKAKLCLNKQSFDKSKEYLERGLDLMKDNTGTSHISFLYFRVVNYLAYVLSRTGDLERARVLLETLVNVELKCEPQVYSTEDLFSNSKIDQSSAKSKIHKLNINNMQMLGWIYGKLCLSNLYADMVHRTLQKELDVDDGDPIQWATRCFRLASLFVANGNWVNARYHLAAAQAVLDPLEGGYCPNSLVFRALADLSRGWVNYGLHLFTISKKSILGRIWSDTEAFQSRESTAPENSQNFPFTGLEVTVPNIPVADIKTTREARDLFEHTQTWLKRARFYYTLRDYPIQYVNIILELSELYKFLAFYEKDLDTQYNVQKKRYDTLETLSSILKEIRPNCYVAVSVEILKETIEVQVELMNINLKKLYNPTEVNHLGSEDLKKRIDTIVDINSKIENLCTLEPEAIAQVVEVALEDSPEAGNSEQITGGDKQMKIEETVDEDRKEKIEIKGEGECCVEKNLETNVASEIHV